MFYKNNSFVAKTFYGVTFQPGEIKDVPGYVNDKDFKRVASPVKQEPPKQVKVIAEESKPVETIDPEPISEPVVESTDPVVESVEAPVEEVQEKPTRRRRKSAEAVETTEDNVETSKEDK